MAETSPGGTASLGREQEEAAFYHEASLNTTWTGVRLMIGVVTSGLGAFVFAFFYLRSVNNYGLWYPKGFGGPPSGLGVLIMALIVVSAAAASFGLTRLKAGRKQTWFSAALAALVLGVAAFARHIPAMSFVEQPPTFAEAAEVQRFQASLSALTLFWNYLAVVAVVLWVLFYLVH